MLQRVYVKVNSDFDRTGYIIPRIITWSDGRIFRIDEVLNFRPASTIVPGRTGSYYTVIIRGEEKLLFFQKTSDLFPSLVDR